MQCVTFQEGRRSGDLHDFEQVGKTVAENDHVIWLDLVDPSDDDFARLRKTFDLHPLAIEDALRG